jgi:hypothetical protein
VSSEIANGRKAQAREVMPMIGGLLDAWDQLPTDVRTDEELSEVRVWIERINSAMENAK